MDIHYINSSNELKQYILIQGIEAAVFWAYEEDVETFKKTGDVRKSLSYLLNDQYELIERLVQ